MKWLEISVYTTDEGLDYVCAALDGAGITGQSIEESRTAAAAFLRESVLYWDFADMDKIGTDRPCVKGYVADCPVVSAWNTLTMINLHFAADIIMKANHKVAEVSLRLAQASE